MQFRTSLLLLLCARGGALLSASPVHVATLAPPLATLRSVGQSYAAISTRHPYITAACTAGCVICLADVTCQSVLQRDTPGLDYRRTAALTLFGTWHYGVPAKSLYLMYDRVLGTSPSLSIATKKMLFDVYIHTPFLLIPSFYVITGVVRGRCIQNCLAQLRREWFTASFGSALFWTPLCLFNFRMIPQHSRVLYVAFCSFIHKTWLSWLSNREQACQVAE